MPNPSEILSPFYSAALRAAQRLPQNFGTPEQMLKMLGKYGAKASELNYLGVPKMLQQYSSRVPKNAIVDYIDANKVLPVEMKLKGADKSASMDDLESRYSDLESDLDDARENGDYDGAELIRQHQADVMEEMENWSKQPGTMYSDYATSPSPAYTEHLIKMPTPSIKTMGRDEYDKAVGNLPAPYQAPHFDENGVNLLAHMRYDTGNTPATYNIPASAGVKSPLFLDELQSDWGQAGRKSGFKGITANKLPEDWKGSNLDIFNLANVGSKISPAPLVTNTNDWTSMLVRRALHEAASQGNDSLAWTPGAWQSARYSGHGASGMTGFYDQMIPNIVKKYVEPYGGKVTSPPQVGFDVTRDGQPVNHFLTRDEANNYLYQLPDWQLNEYDWRSTPVSPANSAPHIATIPDSLKQKLLDEGIPFFSHGGYIS